MGVLLILVILSVMHVNGKNWLWNITVNKQVVSVRNSCLDYSSTITVKLQILLTFFSYSHRQFTGCLGVWIPNCLRRPLADLCKANGNNGVAQWRDRVPITLACILSCLNKRILIDWSIDWLIDYANWKDYYRSAQMLPFNFSINFATISLGTP